MDKDLYIDNGYIDWQLNRIKYILKIYGDDFFKNKTVLELGCFEGGNTKIISNLGAKVTAVEGFDRNLEVCRERYPELNFIKGDCESLEWNYDSHYDIIIHWGLLYHLKNPKVSLEHCLKHTNILLLESIIVDKDDSSIYLKEEHNIWGTDQAVNGYGSRPTAKWVENILDKHNVNYRRHDVADLNSDNQPSYDWIPKNSGKELRRFWTIEI